MAKSPTKTGKAPSTPAATVAETPTPAVNVAKVAKKIPAKKPIEKTVAAVPKVAAVKAKAAAKTKPVPKPQEQPLTILQLASDIIADRLIPTIEQIKSIALSAIGHETAKGKKTKAKKKKK